MNPNLTGQKKLKHHGFSLIELLVVLLVMAVAAALISPSAINMSKRIQFRRQTNELMATLRFARLTAVSKGKEVRVTLSQEEQHTILLTGAATKTKTFDFADDDILTIDPQEIVFFADSMATPATITLASGDRKQVISLDPLSAQPVLQ